MHRGLASATTLASAMIPIMTRVMWQVETPGMNIVGISMNLEFVASFGFILPVNAPQNMAAYLLVLLLGRTCWSWLGYD